jgi:hypothetical protein
MIKIKSTPSVSVTYAQNRSSTAPNELGMRAMQERAVGLCFTLAVKVAV